jgi:hypothetical protein
MRVMDDRRLSVPPDEISGLELLNPHFLQDQEEEGS